MKYRNGNLSEYRQITIFNLKNLILRVNIRLP
nr:MAG TPA: hypothetical protein [Caudoviricetes sp.]